MQKAPFSVRIKIVDLGFCIGIAAELSDEYDACLVNGKGFSRSVEDLLWICNERRVLKVVTRLLEIAADKSSIRAFYFSLDDGYEIYLLSGLDYFNERFVKCKELFHVLIDKPEYRSVNIFEHLQEVTVTFPDDNGKPGSAAASEHIAEIAAMEFLFPYN